MKTIVIYSSDEFVRQALFHSVKGFGQETFHYEDLSEMAVHLETLTPDLILLDLKNLSLKDSDVFQLLNSLSKLIILYDENNEGQKVLLAKATCSMKYPIEMEKLKNQLRVLREEQ